MTDIAVTDPTCRTCRGGKWRYVTQRAGLLSSGLTGELTRPLVRRPCRACAGRGVRSSLEGTGAGVEEVSARLGVVQEQPGADP